MGPAHQCHRPRWWQQKGHHCPNPTEYDVQYLCAPGTYNDKQYQTEEAVSTARVTGTSHRPATAAPAGSVREAPTRPTPPCQPGFYCPESSSDPLPCPPGSFCQFAAIDAPTGLCSAGYYCAGMSADPMPTDGSTGHICPPGYYCPEGSGWPISCAHGTYSPSTGNKNISDCLICEHGEYCADYDLTATTGNCSAGYFCQPGEVTASPHVCPVGHFCLEHTHSPTLCPSGTYEDETTQWTCKPCLSGYYYHNSLGVVTIGDAIRCPAGPFVVHPVSMPTGFNSSLDCSPCLGGQYCGLVGQTTPTGPCDAGYYCQIFIETKTPDQWSYGNICHARGFYFPVGTVTPIACVAGTYGRGSDGAV